MPWQAMTTHMKHDVHICFTPNNSLKQNGSPPLVLHFGLERIHVAHHFASIAISDFVLFKKYWKLLVLNMVLTCLHNGCPKVCRWVPGGMPTFSALLRQKQVVQHYKPRRRRVRMQYLRVACVHFPAVRFPRQRQHNTIFKWLVKLPHLRRKILKPGNPGRDISRDFYGDSS